MRPLTLASLPSLVIWLAYILDELTIVTVKVLLASRPVEEKRYEYVFFGVNVIASFTFFPAIVRVPEDGEAV